MFNFNNLKLGQKLISILILIFVAGSILSASVLSHFLYRTAQTEITSDALMLMETMNAVRDYTGTKVRPLLKNQLENKFLAESVPSYSAREVFERFRMDENYLNFLYKEAALNPTNPRDQAEGFEVDLIKKFQGSRLLTDMQGFHNDGNEELFYIARPITVSKESCLQCHSTPDIAPKSLVERYGTKGGFGWKLNEIVGTQIIFVPASQLLQNARRILFLTMTVILGVFSVVIIAAHFWLRTTIVRPLTRIAHVAEVVSQGDLDAEFQKLSNDEIGRLGKSFSRMKISFALAMKKLEQEKKKNRASD